MIIKAFKITVEAVVEEVKIAGKDWAIVDNEILPSTGQDVKMKPVMGYTPEIQKTVRTEKKIYEQTVDEMDLRAVIQAVNFRTSPNLMDRLVGGVGERDYDRSRG